MPSNGMRWLVTPSSQGTVLRSVLWGCVTGTPDVSTTMELPDKINTVLFTGERCRIIPSLVSRHRTTILHLDLVDFDDLVGDALTQRHDRLQELKLPYTDRAVTHLAAHPEQLPTNNLSFILSANHRTNFLNGSILPQGITVQFDDLSRCIQDLGGIWNGITDGFKGTLEATIVPWLNVVHTLSIRKEGTSSVTPRLEAGLSFIYKPDIF